VAVPDWLDLILAALITVVAVFGYQQGLAAGVLSLTGFACGAAAGAAVAPGLSSALVAAGPNREFLGIVIGFAAAVAGALLGSVLARFLRRVSRRPAGLVDSAGGAVLNVIFLLLVTAVISSFAVSAPPGFLSRQIDRSRILHALNRVAPGADYMFSAIRVAMVRQLDDGSGQNPADLPPPSPSVLSSPAAALARRGVVKVEGVAQSCQSGPEDVDGSGLVIGPDHVLTNAHVVAGLTGPLVVVLASGRTYLARIVLYDRRHDIAVLYVPRLRATVLHFTWSAPFGAHAVVAGFPGGGRFSLTPATIGRPVTATISGTGARWQVYLIRGNVRPGNSGGPVMAPGGRVYGVVFARSPGVPKSGWALTASQVEPDAAAGMKLTTGVPTAARVSC
jgi:S1-C subfamily serine protease